MRRIILVVAALAATIAGPIGQPTSAALAASSMSMVGKPQSWTVGDLVISGAYARATLPHAPVGGGYVAIANKGTADDTLVSASSPMASSVQLHDMKMNGSVMEMRDLPNGVPIPAGKTVTFSPSGLHIMFEHPKAPFVKGKTVPVTLTFAKAGSVTIQLAVGGIAASAPPGAPSVPDSGSSMGGMKM